jgi:peptidyl-prolyl cis-trans isomerase D
MLQTIRDKISGWVATSFLAAIAIVFIFWGMGSRQTSASSSAAKVNGETIPMETVRKAWQERQSRLQQMMRAELPPEFVKSQQQALLDEMIRTRLLTKRAEDLGYRVSDQMVADTIINAEELQVDGKFSRDRYAALLRQQGRTEAQFERELRSNLAVSQLQGGILESSFITSAELTRVMNLQGEEREIDYALISAKALEPTLEVTGPQIQAHYEANKKEYMAPESVDLEYLELSLADIAKEVDVTDSALQSWYEQNKERYESPERRHAQHILIAVGDGVDDAAARKTADEVFAQLKAPGSTPGSGQDAAQKFAGLAAKYSKDPGSAQKGGDLGWAGRGMFVGPFEEALFSMSKGETRGPVKTQFGYHIIRLEDVEPAHVKTLAEVRGEVEDEYRRDRAQALFYDRSQKLADQSFASLTELQSVAKSLGLPLHEIKGQVRQQQDKKAQDESGGKSSEQSLQTNPQFIEAAFSEEVLDKRQNSPLVAIGEDRAVVLRVTDHKLAEQMPLPAVREQIVSQLRTQAAREAASRQGAAALAGLRGGASWGETTARLKLQPVGRKFVGRKDTGVPGPVLSAAFGIARQSLDGSKPAQQPAFAGITLDNGDYALLTVAAVRPGQAESASDREAQQQRIARQVATEEFGGYVQQAEKSATIKRNPGVFEQ